MAVAACGAPAAAPARPTPAAPVIASATAAADAGTRGVVISFRETGLGAGAAVTITASADGFADYGCADDHGRLAGPSLPVTAPVSTLGRLRAGPDGELSGTLTLKPPAPTGIECRAGQVQKVTSARYSNLEVSDVSNRVRAAISGEVASP